ncbi:MAG: glycine--tRNA ligase subunit beta [Arenimonas sp.]|nr:glycine--tRNA ligase subunit beta [Arenimonas sp.]
MNAQSLLIELGTEELPPKALPALADAFARGIADGLAKRGVGAGAAHVLYAPRRLAVRVEAVAAEQPAQKSEVFGPYVNIALDADGQPTPALRAFAQKNGLAIEHLDRISDAKGERFVARSERAGSLTLELLPDIVAESIKAMPIPKPMRWGDRSEQFVRPVHWLVALFGSAVVPMSVLGLKAGRASRGHRFHAPQAVDIADPGSYLDTLRSRHVLADPSERRARIAAQIESAAVSVGKRADVPAELLDEVNCLVEWPAAVLCRFESAFLRVPHEALVSTMQANQKFFPLREADGSLSEYFVGIANIDSKDPAQIKQGYERVIRPRFADAAFFFDEDLKQGIASMADGLASVTYQQKLGSYADKTARIAALAEAVARDAGLDAAQATRAAELSKADLQSRMVGEFPELQGIAGCYYAKAAGESDAVAVAIDEAYQPRFAGDAIAASKLGQVLAIAERLDTLAGGFAAGLKPTGNKDPFALRRNALGLARTLLEGGFDLSPAKLLGMAVSAQPVQSSEANAEALNTFMMDRLRGYFVEKGFTESQFEAVNSGEANRTDWGLSLPDFAQRLSAIAEFAKLPEAAALAAANKRAGNILKKSGHEAAAGVDAGLFAEDAERALWQALQEAEAALAPKRAARDYVAVLTGLAALRAPVDAFFEGVMVNADDSAVRGNRLALLRELAAQFNAVGDISVLA